MRVRVNSFGWGVVAGIALKWYFDATAELRVLRSIRFGFGPRR